MLVTVFGFALGFAISAIISNVFQLVASGESAFQVPVTTDARRLAVIGLLLVAGPHILFHLGRRSLQVGDWPATYVAACFAFSALWAFALGFAVIRVFTNS